MKKLFLTASLFASLHMVAMQLPDQEESITITITQPEQSTIGNFIQIMAVDGNIKVGYITFCQRKDSNTWNLLTLRVNQSYRRNNIANGLMQECINHIKSHNAKLLTWKALPLDSALNLHTLITIYRRLIENMGYTMDSLTLGARKGSGSVRQIKMRLEL